MNIEIPDTVLAQIKFSKKELLIEFAALLYNKTELSWAAGAQLAGLTRDEFMLELSKRNIPIKYSILDLENDMDSYNSFVNDSGK